MYSRLGLVLTVTHACNMRCSYCYAGDKSARTMSEDVGRKSIDRALASLAEGGTLELGFFGGEPMLQAALIGRLIDHARDGAKARRATVSLTMTSNGTVTTDEAWRLATLPEMDLTISYDGLPEVHDKHRRFANGSAGRGSSEIVLSTIRRLLDAGKDLRVLMVARPDTLDDLPAGIRFIHKLGVRHIEPSLDLWTKWSEEDEVRLERIIGQCANVWRDSLPLLSMGWFDEKAAQLGKVPISATARCGFGDGEVAIAPSGRLYPCERLIGSDEADNPMALAGHALDGADFLNLAKSPARTDEECGQCTMSAMCTTMCRCSNYVRSGDIRRPDRLLCTWNQACLTETARVLNELAPKPGGLGNLASPAASMGIAEVKDES